MAEEQKNKHKPVIGITIGDVNGIGPEVIIKTLLDDRILDLCTPVIYGSPRVLSYYLKTLDYDRIPFNTINTIDELKEKTVNVKECAKDKINIKMGQPSEETGQFALQALDDALQDVTNQKIEAFVTAPLNKNTIKPAKGEFSGHTSYIAGYCQASSHLMLMVSDTIKVGLVTEHLPVGEVVPAISQERIYETTSLLHNSLERDFELGKGKIAVLGLNPHAGDSGLLGSEEHDLIQPAVEQAKEKGIYAFGPYSADGFFGSLAHQQFDAVLAMYHDQGLIPFKTISFGEGVNFTAGLPIVRTSPDHGTAYNLVGKDVADATSMMNALFKAVDIVNSREHYDQSHQNPLERKVMAKDFNH
jgi:4-hydroxythreonine-4-phosphate dehydrogenase